MQVIHHESNSVEKFTLQTLIFINMYFSLFVSINFPVFILFLFLFFQVDQERDHVGYAVLRSFAGKMLYMPLDLYLIDHHQLLSRSVGT